LFCGPVFLTDGYFAGQCQLGATQGSASVMQASIGGTFLFWNKSEKGRVGPARRSPKSPKSGNCQFENGSLKTYLMTRMTLIGKAKSAAFS
jgi:hypothetical protein